MKEVVSRDYEIDKMNEDTINLIKEYFPTSDFYIDDCRVIIDVGLRFYRYESRFKFINKLIERHKCIASFYIKYSNDSTNMIRIFECGKEYYDTIKSIGEQLGYEILIRSWD